MSHSTIKKNFFITGNPAVGKTTLIKEIIQIKPELFGGFYTEQESGELPSQKPAQREGFVIRTTDGVAGLFASKNPDKVKHPSLKFNKYYIDTATLEKIAIPAVDSAIAQNKIAVIDEIGSMEILSGLRRLSLRRLRGVSLPFYMIGCSI